MDFSKGLGSQPESPLSKQQGPKKELEQENGLTGALKRKKARTE